MTILQQKVVESGYYNIENPLPWGIVAKCLLSVVADHLDSQNGLFAFSLYVTVFVPVYFHYLFKRGKSS